MAALTAAGLFLSAGCSAAQAGGRVEIPVNRTRLSDGTVRFTVPARIGDGAPFEAMLETSTSGLRVLSRAATSPEIVLTGPPRGFSFSTGLVLHGPLAAAVIHIGAAVSVGPMKFQLVRRISCTAIRLRCPAALSDVANYGIGGNGLYGEGFAALLGIAQSGADLPGFARQPLRHLGTTRWVLILPRPDGRSPGKLILNPESAEVAAFRPVDMHRGNTLAGAVPQPVDLMIPDCPERPLAAQDACSKVPLNVTAQESLPLFYHYAVLYDVEAGTVSIKQRND